MVYDLICVVCESHFTSNRNTAKTCSPECRLIHKRERQRTHDAKQRARERYAKEKAEEELKQIAKTSTLIERTVEARKAGLSYGKYMASIERGARYTAWK